MGHAISESLNQQIVTSQSMKVLVVDDVGLVRHCMDRMLVDLGFNVATAASGREAIEAIISDTSIGAVVTDLLMPGMDGIELFKASRNIKRSTDAGEIPPPEFILMTAQRPSANVDDKQTSPMRQALSLGFVDAMLKPVDKERLFRHLSAINGRRNVESSKAAGSSEVIVRAGDTTPTPPASRVSENYEGLQSTVAEVRTTAERRLSKFQEKYTELEEELSELRALVEELRGSS
jgi:CheY-like chemotaxis protein